MEKMTSPLNTILLLVLIFLVFNAGGSSNDDVIYSEKMKKYLKRKRLLVLWRLQKAKVLYLLIRKVSQQTDVLLIKSLPTLENFLSVKVLIRFLKKRRGLLCFLKDLGVQVQAMVTTCMNNCAGLNS